MQENRRALVGEQTARGRGEREIAGERMKDQAPSHRRGVPVCARARSLVGSLVDCRLRGERHRGSLDGRRGRQPGQRPAAAAAAARTGGSGTGGSAAAAGDDVGGARQRRLGCTGGNGGERRQRRRRAGSGGKGGAVGSGGSSGGSSGAGGHAGSGGASQGGNSGGGSGASHCGARPGMVFCDDFEADAPGAPPAPWTTTEGTATQVTVDGTNPAKSGSKSVHVAADQQRLRHLPGACTTRRCCRCRAASSISASSSGWPSR